MTPLRLPQPAISSGPAPIRVGLSRRRFVYSSAVAGASLWAGPFITRGASPNKKLNIGMIGVNGKGTENIKGMAGENIVALCDVDGQSLDKAATQFPKAKTYRDFRRMFEQKDLDAVVVTIPDHCHAAASMMAIKL